MKISLTTKNSFMETVWFEKEEDLIKGKRLDQKIDAKEDSFLLSLSITPSLNLIIRRA